LISISTCGIIFTPGSAGTRQEIFQNACLNHYANEEECMPMMFLGDKFWKDDGVYQLVEKTAAGRPYAKWLLCTDDIHEIISHVNKFRKERKLPVLTVADYKGRFWDKSGIVDEEDEEEGEKKEDKEEKEEEKGEKKDAKTRTKKGAKKVNNKKEGKKDDNVDDKKDDKDNKKDEKEDDKKATKKRGKKDDKKDGVKATDKTESKRGKRRKVK